MKDLSEKILVQILDEAELNEGIVATGLLMSFIAGGVSTMALYQWIKKKLMGPTECGRLDTNSSDYAICMSKKYEKLAVEFETRSRTDCLKFTSGQDSCKRKLEDVTDEFHTLASKWGTKFKELRAEEREKAIQAKRAAKEAKRAAKA